MAALYTTRAHEPVTLYSKLDDGRWELRKVEIFTDGRRGAADKTHFTSAKNTKLSIEPIPSLEDILRDKQFVSLEISKQDFEIIWNLK